MDLAKNALAAFAMLFFVPSLSVRYGSMHGVAIACGLVVVVAGAVWGIARTTGGSALRLLVSVVLGVVVAVPCGLFAMAQSEAMREQVLAVGAIAFLATAIGIMRIVEIALAAREPYAGPRWAPPPTHPDDSRAASAPPTPS